MKPKKLPKPTKKDKAWQEKVEERTKAEKVELSHPRGKERFKEVVRRMGKKNG